MPLTLVAPLATVPQVDAGDGGTVLPDGGLPVTVPVTRAGRTPWRQEGEVTWVPAALLLAAAGRCSCDDCCAVLARSKARARLSTV